MFSTVSIVKGEEPSKMVKNAIDLIGGIETFVKPKDKVLIKPNLCFLKKPETGATTDPRIVGSIIDLIQPITDDISIIESNAAAVEAETIWSYCGYYELAEEKNVKLVNLSKEPTTIWNEIRLPKMLFTDHVLVNVPKLKLNTLTTITCGMKNLFGLVPSRHRAKYHRVINDLIIELNRAFKSSLVVVDGLVGMEGDGVPTAGKPVIMGLVIASNNVFSVDLVASTIMGINPTYVHHLLKAVEAGLGVSDLSQIRILGEDVWNVREEFKLPSSPPPAKRLTEWLLEHSETFGIRQAVQLLSWRRRSKFGKKPRANI